LYDSQLSLSTYCASAGTGSCSSTNREHVVYSLADSTLTETVDSGSTPRTQTIIGPSGPSSIAKNLRAGAVVHDSSVPLFRYYDRNGNQLSTSAVSGSPSTS